MSANLRIAPSPSEASIDALAEVSLAIAEERNQTEREIKRLLEANEDQKALRLMRQHLGVEPKLKRVK